MSSTHLTSTKRCVIYGGGGLLSPAEIYLSSTERYLFCIELIFEYYNYWSHTEIHFAIFTHSISVINRAIYHHLQRNLLY